MKCIFLVWVLPYQHDHHQIMRNSCYDKLGVGIADTCQANQSTLKWGHNGKATLFLFFQWILFSEIHCQNMKYLSDFFWYFHVTFSDMCPIFAWYPGEMFRAFEVKCRPIFETPADLLHIFATRHYCHLYQSKQHHHNNHHHQNNKHNHQNNKHHQNTTTTATTTKTQPPSQKTLKLWDPETLRHWEPDTDRRGHLMWKKLCSSWLDGQCCTMYKLGDRRDQIGASQGSSRSAKRLSTFPTLNSFNAQMWKWKGKNCRN